VIVIQLLGPTLLILAGLLFVGAGTWMPLSALFHIALALEKIARALEKDEGGAP